MYFIFDNLDGTKNGAIWDHTKSDKEQNNNFPDQGGQNKPIIFFLFVIFSNFPI